MLNVEHINSSGNFNYSSYIVPLEKEEEERVDTPNGSGDCPIWLPIYGSGDFPNCPPLEPLVGLPKQIIVGKHSEPE